MKDTIAAGTVAGLAGTVALTILTYFAIWLGIDTSTPWNVAAYMFLNPKYAGTIYWYLIGMLGSASIGIVVGVLTAIIIKLTGNDYAWLKGALAAEAVGFAGISLIAPLLNIAGFLKFEPVSNVFAFVSLFVFGIVAGYIIQRFANLTRY